MKARPEKLQSSCRNSFQWHSGYSNLTSSPKLEGCLNQAFLRVRYVVCQKCRNPNAVGEILYEERNFSDLAVVSALCYQAKERICSSLTQAMLAAGQRTALSQLEAVAACMPKVGAARARLVSSV